MIKTRVLIGYNFKSLQQISPFLEHTCSGISSLWARKTALKYDCCVVVGYPEKVDVTPKWPTSPEYYNSAIIVNGNGETIANYRKSFLYYTDETWALEGGEGFFEGCLPGLGNAAMGICMDINPYRFEAPWHAFEFAFHVLEVDANLVIMSMAWLMREDQRMFSRMPKEPDMETLTYWVTRLEPIIRSENEDEIIVVFCNRTGLEDDAVYAGTSAVLGIKQGEVNVYGILGRGDKDLLVVDTEKTPFAQLVYRPGNEHSQANSDLQQCHFDWDKSTTSELNDEQTKEPSVRKATPNPGQPRKGSKDELSRTDKAHKSASNILSGRPMKPVNSAQSLVSIKSKYLNGPMHPNQAVKRGRSLEEGQAKPEPPLFSKISTHKNMIKSPGKERPFPKITIPVHDSKLTDDIPTPTAPSPTPVELRPRFGFSQVLQTRDRKRDSTPHLEVDSTKDP